LLDATSIDPATVIVDPVVDPIIVDLVVYLVGSFDLVAYIA
jgi:hypothetical protein